MCRSLQSFVDLGYIVQDMVRSRIISHYEHFRIMKNASIFHYNYLADCEIIIESFPEAMENKNFV